MGKDKDANEEMIPCPYCDGRKIWTDAHGLILDGTDHCPACHGNNKYSKKDWEDRQNRFPPWHVISPGKGK